MHGFHAAQGFILELKYMHGASPGLRPAKIFLAAKKFSIRHTARLTFPQLAKDLPRPPPIGSEAPSQKGISSSGSTEFELESESDFDSLLFSPLDLNFDHDGRESLSAFP